ncbi:MULTISPECIES: hypothetical protein [unclassified Bradyrhizobium]|uniref:hypothetical protein n=1 Tax=unclassified Bradyrhizobium TaxID=2631580 RepID=UPI001FEF3D5B|nr:MULTISPECIES: hypothetical protein [unclassified Bradyrhizobium]
MARKNDGAGADPKLIRTDVDCRAARPKFNEGAWSSAKISDVTGGGLYLFATPDEGRPGDAASKALADAALSSNTLDNRLRLLGIDTKTDHCAH